MQKLTTFEDIFNKLIDDYLKDTVKIENKKNGLIITSLITNIDKIYIKPLPDNKEKKWTKDNKKTGSIVIASKNNNKYHTIVNIPFLLGLNTMNAIFMKEGANIKTFAMEFSIKKLSSNQKQLA